MPIENSITPTPFFFARRKWPNSWMNTTNPIIKKSAIMLNGFILSSFF
jgi:hypothetical protein